MTRESPQVLFVLAHPDVYKSPNSDCYIVFGEAKIEDTNSQAQLNAAQQLASANSGAPAIQDEEKEDDGDDDIPELEAAPEDDGPVDETGVDPKDIELVIQQVGCSRAKAVKALKDSGGDLINASECPRSLSRSLNNQSVCSHGSQRVKSFCYTCNTTTFELKHL